MQVAGSLSLTEACAIGVAGKPVEPVEPVEPEELWEALVPLHPATTAPITPTVTRIKKSCFGERERYFTRRGFLQSSDSMATVAFHSFGEY
jgi:hypothetical protein